MNLIDPLVTSLGQDFLQYCNIYWIVHPGDTFMVAGKQCLGIRWNKTG